MTTFRRSQTPKKKQTAARRCPRRKEHWQGEGADEEKKNPDDRERCSNELFCLMM